jgi:hypothetical protein
MKKTSQNKIQYKHMPVSKNIVVKKSSQAKQSSMNTTVRKKSTAGEKEATQKVQHKTISREEKKNPVQ